MSNTLKRFWSVTQTPSQKAAEDSTMQKFRARLELNPEDNPARLGIEWIQYTRKMRQLLGSLVEPPIGPFDKDTAMDYFKFEVQFAEELVRTAHENAAVADLPYLRGDPSCSGSLPITTAPRFCNNIVTISDKNASTPLDTISAYQA